MLLDLQCHIFGTIKMQLPSACICFEFPKSFRISQWETGIVPMQEIYELFVSYTCAPLELQF